uniref:DUF6534 domain-containing protein n=1 Tax=Mycena chlorophos TaxID=658473 RepID=A0ABQ0KUR6_MYCCL|nr:predicted protein [Mycena chlorophos]
MSQLAACSEPSSCQQLCLRRAIHPAFASTAASSRMLATPLETLRLGPIRLHCGSSQDSCDLMRILSRHKQFLIPPTECWCPYARLNVVRGFSKSVPSNSHQRGRRIKQTLSIEGMSEVGLTLGPLLIGGSIALVLSGMVTVQSIVFYKLYPNEMRIRLGMVFLIWILDAAHSIFIVAALFDYFIKYFGDVTRAGYIPWSIGLSVLVTAITTLIVHMYYAQKIFKSSGRNWWITAPVLVLAFLRLFAASVSTAEMIRLRRYSAFTEKYPGWVFTTGLSLSAGVDIIITFLLCYFLRRLRRRTASTPMAHVVDVLTIYTLENGLLTCLMVTASLICWVTMQQNLVFLGLHFVIGKLYANSCLISLNTRKALREMRWGQNDWDPAMPPLSAEDFAHQGGSAYAGLVSITASVKEPAASYRPTFQRLSPRAAISLASPSFAARSRAAAAWQNAVEWPWDGTLAIVTLSAAGIAAAELSWLTQTTIQTTTLSTFIHFTSEAIG